MIYFLLSFIIQKINSMTPCWAAQFNFILRKASAILGSTEGKMQLSHTDHWNNSGRFISIYLPGKCRDYSDNDRKTSPSIIHKPLYKITVCLEKFELTTDFIILLSIHCFWNSLTSHWHFNLVLCPVICAVISSQLSYFGNDPYALWDMKQAISVDKRTKRKHF